MQWEASKIFTLFTLHLSGNSQSLVGQLHYVALDERKKTLWVKYLQKRGVYFMHTKNGVFAKLSLLRELT